MPTDTFGVWGQYDPEPTWIDTSFYQDGTTYITRSLNGSYVYANPKDYTLTSNVWQQYTGEPTYLDSEGDIPEMSVYQEILQNVDGKAYTVACKDKEHLSQDKILKSLVAMKARLEMECLPIKLANVECKMTKTVERNLINAYKRTHRYGKDMPFIARYDEFGRRLPDEINLDTLYGMTIKLIDNEEYGEYYIEFKGLTSRVFSKDKKEK